MATTRPSLLIAATALIALAADGASGQTAPPTLTQLRFDIIGVRLVVDPPALTVPKNIPTQINTSLATPPGLGNEVRDAIATLTDGAQVEAELRGPSLPPTRIAAAAGQPLPIPPLALPGDYFLDGIRLVRNGETILDATAADGKPATTIPIKVINEVFVTSVTSKPLSLDDIRSKGIVIDEKNFSAVNFQVAFNIDGTPFTISAPAVLPTPELLRTTSDRTVLIQQLTAMNRTLAATQTTLPPQFDRPGLNFSIAALPFFPVEDDNGDKGFDTPPVTGLIVIPGNVAFLNQFFSAMLLVANVAPDGSRLDLRDVTGTIVLPKGLDRIAGTFDAPGDDPLRLARLENAGGAVQPAVAIAQRGPDGKLGTADDIPIVPPQKQGEGEFLIEGLQEGSHAFDITIRATLTGLPSGPVTLEGQAAGAVFVRNPTFSVTLAHPRTVRSGEPYSVYATVTNTSRAAANLVSVNLDPRSITGAQLTSDPTVTFETIPPGQSVVAKYSLIAQLTGDVTFSSFTGDAALGGGIRLETGVDERGVPLSANAIVLPRAVDALPPSLVIAAQRVLGQAFSVATAPAEALPAGVLFVKRQTVIDRGLALAQAGDRVKFGEPLSRVVQDLLLDWLGNDGSPALDDGFDQILRETDAGAALLGEFGAVIAPDAIGARALDYQRQFAQATVGRASHLSAIAAGPAGKPAPALTVTRASGGSVGASSDGADLSSTLPSAAPFALSAIAAGGETSQLAIVARPDPDRYTVAIVASAAGAYDLGVVVPAGTSGRLRQLRFAAIQLDLGGTARVEIDLAGSGTPTLSIDRNGDGIADGTRAADPIDVTAGPPRLVAVRQIESSSSDVSGSLTDPATYGLLVGALFDAPVTQASAEDKTHYAIETNAVIGAQLQAGRRLVYLYLQKPLGGLVQRSLTVDGVVDDRGAALAAATVPIATVFTDGAHVFGQVRDAGGAGVGGGTLKLTVVFGIKSFDVAAFRTDSSGSFDFDFVPRVGDRFVLTAQHPLTRDLATLSAKIRGAGEQLLLNPTFLGRGLVRGRVIGTDGATGVANVPVALIPGSVLGSRGFQGRTNALGEFTFTDVPVGVFTLSASDGAGAFGQTTGLLARAGDVVVRDVPLVSQPDDGGRLVGRVFLGDGTTPGAGFTIYAGSYDRAKGTIAAVDQTQADAVGAFTFARALPPNGYDVVAFDSATQQLGAVRANVIAGTTTSVSIVLESTGSVEGVVFNGRGDRVAGAVVAGGVALVTADANGFFRITGVPAGSRTIDAGDPVTRRRGSARVTVLPGQTVSAAITLESRATITGRVLDAAGNPVPGASVRIPQVGGYTFVIANNQGVFKFPDLTLGEYLLQAPGPSKESLIAFMQANAIDPATAFTAGDGPEGGAPAPSASDKNAVLAAYQQAVQTFFSVDESLLEGLPMASIGGFGWNKVALFQDATTAVADVRFLPQGTVSGRTVDGGNRPTGAAVRVSALKVALTGAPEFRELARLNTDPATGVFSFGGIPRFDLATFQTSGVRGGDFTLEAATPFSPAHPQFRGQLSTATPNLSDVVLQFPAAVDTNGTISGRVFMPDGVTPVPAGTQVRISFGDLTVLTDATGTFRSLLPIPAGTYFVTAQTVAGLRGQTMAQVPAGGNVDIAMQVLGLGAVSIVVTRPNGVPVANAAVSLVRASFPGDRADGTTDAHGVVRFVNITEGPFGVTAQEAATGLSGRASGSIVRDKESTASVVITASGSVTGTFVSATDGRGIPFAQIVLSTGGIQAYATTDASGRFAAAGIPIGAFTAEGFDPLTNRRGRTIGAIQIEGQSVDVTILQAPRGTVRGVVLNADGVSPVPAARVSFVSSSFVETRLQATALADGSFRFEGAPAGSFKLEATDPVSGFKGSATGTLTLEGEVVDANVTLAPFGSIHVTILDVDGQPAPNATVSIAGRDAAADSHGQFTFEHLALDSYHIVARSLADTNNGGDATAKIESANQIVEATVRFRGVGTVAVTVVPSTGSGVVPGAEVTLAAKAAAGEGNPGPLATTLNGFTDGNGVVTFQHVPVGDFSVRAESAALAGIATGTVPAPSTSTSVTVQLGASGSVAGRLLLPDGATPAANAFVTLRFQSQSSLQSGVLQVTTNLTGAFEFRGIPLGTFTLSAIEVVSAGVRSAAGTIATDGQRVDVGTLTLDNTAPRVLQVAPADRSTNQGARGPLVITFSEPVARSSIRVGVGGNVTLLEGPTTVPLAAPEFSQDGTTVTLRPSRDLVSGALATLSIVGAPDGPQDESGFTMPDAFVSTFTVRDSIPPVVVSVSPAANATQVPPDASIRIAYSEPVATSTVLVRDQAGATVAGTTAMTIGGAAVVFAPADFLHANATYSVTVSNVADLAGNPLPGGTFTSSFATIDTIAPVIGALQLAGAARAGATVTLRPSIAATDVQRVEYSIGSTLARVVTQAPFDAAVALPAGAPTVTVTAVAFDMFGNRSTPFVLPITIQPNAPPTVTLTSVGGISTVGQGQTVQFQVRATDDDQLAQVIFTAVGAVSTSQVQNAAPGQTDLTHVFSLIVPAGAPSNSTITVQAAATDAAGGQSVPATTTLTVKDAARPTVTVVAPVNNATVAAGQSVDVVVDASDDVALASIALVCTPSAVGCNTRTLNPATATSRQTFAVTVPASLQAPQTLSISVVATDTSGNTGATGRVLQLADTVKPSITALASASGSPRVTAGTTATLQATVADNVGVTALTFTAEGSLTASGATVVSPALASGTTPFSLSIPGGLANGATITVRVRARDAAANLSDEASIVLTVGDTSPPSLTVLEPADGASVAPGGTLTVRATATDDVAVRRFTLTITGAFAFSDARDITPPSTPASAAFTVTVPQATAAAPVIVTIEAFDTDNRSSGALSRTIGVSDVVAPAVQVATPLQDAAIDPRSPVAVVVNATDAVGVTSVSFTASGAVVASETRTVPSSTARSETFTVNISPLPIAGGSLTLNAAARDAAGNLGTAQTVTVRLLDVVPPDVASIQPVNGATAVDPTAPVVIRFTEPMDRSTLTASTIQLRRGTTIVPATLAIGGTDDVVTLTPVTLPLAANATFTVDLSTTVADKAGNRLAAPRSSTFTTASLDVTAPRLASIDPPTNATDVSLANPVTVTFSEAIDPATVTTQSFRVRIGATPVAGSFTLLGGNVVVRFTPAAPLPADTLVVTELSNAITDAAGNALVAGDGSALTAPLSFSFTTGRFSITSPSGDDVVENSRLVLEARTTAALGVASVLFTVNGSALPAVSGPPFTTTFDVGSAASTPTLTIVASARNSSGVEVASDQRTFAVVVGLSVSPTLIGVPVGGSRQLRFAVSSPLAADLPIALSAGDPTLVSFPANPVVLRAGTTQVDAAIAGTANGATAVLGTSAHGVAGAIVAVSPIQIGQTLTPLATPAGVSLSNPAASGFVAAPGGATRRVRVTLSAPIAAGATVSVFTTNAAVATAAATVAGAQAIDVDITTLADGVATLVVRAGNQAVGLTVFVGAPPAGSVPLLVAPPAGLSISNAPNAGQVIATAGRQITLTVPLLASPAAVDTPVQVTTANAGVATVVNGIVRAGQTSATVTITTVADGITTLTVRADDVVRSVTIFVGTPPAGLGPILTAPPVGLSLAALPTLGRTFAPIAVTRTLGVRLFESPVAVNTAVTVTTSDPNVASVSGPTAVLAGQQIAMLNVSTGTAGTATLTIEAAGVRRELTIVVGSDPTPGTTPPIVAAPVGVTVAPNPSIGRVFGTPGNATVATLGVPLLGGPATAATPVTVTSGNPSVVTLGGSATTTITIPAGAQAIQLPIALSGTQGAALLTIEFAGERRELLIVVGNPSASEIPAVTAPVVGVRIGQ